MTRFEIHTKAALVLLIFVLSLIIGSAPNCARAGEDPGELFNYSFAIWLGSGVYKVQNADKRFAVLRVPAAVTLRPANLEKSALIDRLGFRLLLPAAVGFEEETDTDFSFGAVAFVPGLEVQIPINQYWALKPFAQLGAGKDTAGGDLQYIYGGGLRGLISIPWKKFVFGIGNSVVLAEDRDATSKNTSGFSMFNAGLDVRHPTDFTIFNRQLDVSVFFVANFFRNRVDILSDDGETDRINTLYDVGLTFGLSESLSIWKVDLDRVGIDYRWGDQGFKGIGFNLGFPF
ncbi:MAG: hypothetical protein WBM69_01530 [Desulfobacterales bacterium]